MKFSEISERVKNVLIQLGEEEEKDKKKKADEEAKKKESELAEEKRLKDEEEEKDKKFAEKFGRHFSEHSKGLEDRMCKLEEGMGKMLEMSEKMLSKK